MPPYSFKSTSSDSDSDDFPENFSLVHSKRAIEILDDTLKKFHAAERQKQKQKNREKDSKLKERTEATRKRKLSADVDGDAQARMARAMRDAEGETADRDRLSGDEMMGSDESESQDSDGSMELAGVRGDAMLLNDGGGGHWQGDDSDDMTTVAKPDRHLNHLPDHLFTSAFAHQAQPSPKRISPTDAPLQKKTD